MAASAAALAPLPLPTWRPRVAFPPSVAGKTEVTHPRAFRFLSAAGTVAAQPDWCGGY